MRKLYTLIALLFSIFFASAQTTVVINTGTAGTPAYNAGPIYRSSTSSAYDASRYAYLYTQSELASVGILPGSIITELGWVKNNTATSTGGGIYRIFMKNSTATAFSNASETWANLNSSTVMVYENLSFTVPATATPNYITFTLSSPFTYTGGALEISTEWDINQVAGNPSTGTFDWLWSTVPDRIYGTGNTTLAPITSLSSTTNSISAIDDRRPFIQIVFNAGAACVDPPTAGQATSNASLTGVCSGSAVQLNLTGNSTGTGQTYKWKSSSSQFGSYTDISAQLPSPSFSVNPTSTTWYRVEVKCGSGTPVESAPVEVIVIAALPAGTYTINNTQPTAGTNFQSFAAAISSMNCGVAGHVFFDVSAGQTFNESPEITVSGGSSSTITFRKAGAGANPKISKGGTSGTVDYLLKLTGVDYITFDGIDFEQTGTSATDFVEYGVFIVNSSATNGAQHNTFKNGVVTMGYVSATSRGFFMDDVITPTASSGTNSFNKFLNMKIQNAFNGYYITGATNTFTDDGNQITTESGGISQITNLGNGSTTGAIYGVYASYQSNFLLSNTEISNCIGATTGVIYGAYFLSSTANSVTFSNNHLFGFTGGGTLNGFYMTTGATLTADNNHIHGLRTTNAASSSIRGMDITGAATFTGSIYNNRIYDISSAGLVNTSVAGIEIGAGAAYTIHNNMISDLRAPASTLSTGGIKGISIVTTTAGSVIRLYYNSVYLSETGTVPAYSSAILYNSSSTPILDIRNNLFLNKTDVSAGMRAVVLWKANPTVNFNTASDNNLYYAGTPGIKRYIYFNGTDSVQQLNDYKLLPGISPRDANSVTENTSLLPITTGIIRIEPNVQSLAESGGQEIAGYASDLEGTQRGPYPLNGQTNGAGSKPDIGADEYDGRGLDIVGPIIEYTPLANTSSTANRSIVVTITDVSGVQTGANGPRLYYRKSGSSTYIIDNNPTVSGNQYTFTFNHASIGGLIGGDVVEYYVAAQDLNGYSSTSPFGGSGANPPGTDDPPVLSTYQIKYNLSGVYTVGPSGNYQNLTSIAALLNNGNLAEVVGNVAFELQANYDGTSGETFPIQFNQFLTTDPGWTVTIRPATGATALVTSGDPGSANPLISFNGVDRLVFDGRPGGNGTGSEWLLRNTRTAATMASVFRLIDDAANDTLRYLNLESQATSTSYGVVHLSTSATGTTGNSFNMIANNRISGRTDGTPTTTVTGVYSAGTTAVPNTDNRISNNHIVNFNNYGIFMSGAGNGNNWVIEGNHLYGDISTTVAKYGIYQTSDSSRNTQILNNYIGGIAVNATGLMTVNGNVTVAGINITDGKATIKGNTIANITNTNTGTSARIRGINISSILQGTDTLSNNTIFNLSTSGAGVGVAFGTQPAAGILIAPSGVFVHYAVHHNTIYNIAVENTTALASTNIVAGLALYNLQNTTVANNRIYDIKNKTTGVTPNQPPVAAGIFGSFLTNTTTVNNMVSLGATESTNTQFIGIMQLGRGTGNVHNYFYNSVFIGGSAGGDFNSYGFTRGLDTTTEQHQVATLRNNLFHITRSGGASGNYAIASRGLIPGGGWTSNYNNLYSSNSSTIGYWNATGNNLAAWQTASSNDANSKVTEAFFANSGTADLHLSGASVGNVQLGGIPIAGVTVDFDLQARNTIRPYMGADEAAIGLPVKLEYFKGVRQNNVHVLSWKGQCTGNDNSFTVERSANAKDFIAIGEIKASRIDCDFALGLTDRTPLPGTNYYRLKIKDENGRISYSIIIAILNKETGLEIVSVFPTLTESKLFVNVAAVRKINLNISIIDGNGRTVQKIGHAVPQGSSLINLDVSNLGAGSYILQCVTADGYEKATRFVKQ